MDEDCGLERRQLDAIREMVSEFAKGREEKD